MSSSPRIAVFGPDPLVAVAVEAHPDGTDEIHVHAAGQGVWAARIAAELGGDPVLCAFTGGETGAVLEGLVGSIDTHFVRWHNPPAPMWWTGAASASCSRRRFRGRARATRWTSSCR